jgi:mannose-1-phosphate guanylyltransferase
LNSIIKNKFKFYKKVEFILENKNNKIFVIMAGGKGERFWPKSRLTKPKQTLSIGTKKPLLVETIDRILSLSEEIYLSTSTALEEPFRKLLRDYQINYLIEPLGRDTAAAIGYCCHVLEKKFSSNHLVAFMGSDYLIPEKELFQRHLETAFRIADHDNVIVTLGIHPTRPATGYGYIQEGEEISDPIPSGIRASKVKGFREKPNRDTAIQYIDSGKYYWNSGMFVTKIGVMIEEIRKFIPNHHEAFVNMKNKDFTSEVVLEQFKNLEKISIDFAVMEKTPNIAMVKSLFRWDDMGDWLAYERVSEIDNNNNTISGKWAGLETNNCIIYNDSEKLVGTIGIKDLIIVNTKDAIMICHKDDAQNVKKLVQRLSESEETNSFI